MLAQNSVASGTVIWNANMCLYRQFIGFYSHHLKQLLTQDLSRMTRKDFDEEYQSSELQQHEIIHPYFSPLKSWELPDPLSLGSGEAAHHPVQHLLRTMPKSWNPPWPI